LNDFEKKLKSLKESLDNNDTQTNPKYDKFAEKALENNKFETVDYRNKENYSCNNNIMKKEIDSDLSNFKRKVPKPGKSGTRNVTARHSSANSSRVADYLKYRPSSLQRHYRDTGSRLKYNYSKENLVK
jgi:Mn-containing catalase